MSNITREKDILLRTLSRNTRRSIWFQITTSSRHASDTMAQYLIDTSLYC
jgi:hypothetical protein